MTNPLLPTLPTPDDREVVGDLVKVMIADQRIRTEVTRESHEWFFLMYFAEYVRFSFAPFHREMFMLSEDANNPMLAVQAFRGSAKSTIFSMSFPIWEILGKHQAKFVIIVGQTQQQARQYLSNLKRELTTNELLKRDLGPFTESSDEWNAGSIVLTQYDARITAISVEQSIRGLRHGSYRPDVIVCDDLENLESVKTRESREKLYRWVLGELIPAGDLGTRVVIIGNCLHDDGLMARLKGEIEAGSRKGIFRSYPLLDDVGRCLWPGKFPTPESIESLKQSVVDEQTWYREYLLRITATADQVCDPALIQFYDALPEKTDKNYVHEILIGVDVAISESTAADYTAFVPVIVYADYDRGWCAYVLPQIMNQRISFWECIDQLELLSKALDKDRVANVYIEQAGLQTAWTETLHRKGVKAYSMSINGMGKRERITIVTPYMRDGMVKFPRHGAEDLICQLVGFGRERHDDIVDAFTLAIRRVIEQPPRVATIHFIDLFGRPDNDDFLKGL